MWRLVYALPLWIAYSAVSLSLWMIGVPLVFALSRARAWRAVRSRVYADQRQILAWRGGWLTWIWGNEEDGVCGAEWYRALHADWNDRRQALMWSAFRNPTNNLRFVPGINPRIVASRVHYRGSYDPDGDAVVSGRPAYALTWQRLFAGFYAVVPFRGSLYRFWWGWKLRPRDRAGIAPGDYRYPRCGFATQLKRIA